MDNQPLVAERIVRTGSANTPTRKLVVVNGSGRDKTEQVLEPAIEKVESPPQFRHGNSHIPIEQYGFRVNGVTYERFADAAAIVMGLNRVQVASELAQLQIYVRGALVRMRDPSLINVAL